MLCLIAQSMLFGAILTGRIFVFQFTHNTWPRFNALEAYAKVL